GHRRRFRVPDVILDRPVRPEEIAPGHLPWIFTGYAGLRIRSILRSPVVHAIAHRRIRRRYRSAGAVDRERRHPAKTPRQGHRHGHGIVWGRLRLRRSLRIVHRDEILVAYTFPFP